MRFLGFKIAASVWSVVVLIGPVACQLFAQDPSEEAAPRPEVSNSLRVLGPDQIPADQRKNQTRNIISDEPFQPPHDRKVWEARRRDVKTRILVSMGLWPMPPRPELTPVIHGMIRKDGYTIEKVYFESLPGHYVSGNLYRPDAPQAKRPAVLFPHGHWGSGRTYEADPEEVEKQLQSGGERFEANARFPLQAPLANLARMGCVVFQHDMVGRGDSRSIEHGSGFDDAEAVLRLQSFMGLQTWNSVRALDFLSGLPDVDPTRIGVTGASGGATQTFILCAIDDRPACAFPAVMVSTSMQGGCACENAPLLRIGGGNVEFAALFAPKPLGMTTANDWTLHFDRKGFPELEALYRMLGAPTSVMMRAFPQFRHNYNQVSREVMYEWMNQHLGLDASSVAEQPIDPVMPADLSVYDDDHHPEMLPAAELRQEQSRISDSQLASVAAVDRESLSSFQDQLRAALEVMVASRFPAAGDVAIEKVGNTEGDGFRLEKLLLARVADKHLFVRESVPTAVFIPQKWDGKRMMVWVDAQGHAGLLDDMKGAPNAALKSVLDRGIAVISPDVLLTGEFIRANVAVRSPTVSMEKPRFTLCYNRTILANRVHDILTAIGLAKHHYRAPVVDLVGFGESGPWVVLARSLCGDHVRRTIVDFNEFSFSTVADISDPMLLPGGLKYGDLIGIARLLVPGEAYVKGVHSLGQGLIGLRQAYECSGQSGALAIPENEPSLQDALDWITRP